MAALYLHNALFSREPVPPTHSRTWSNATLRTTNEPLLDNEPGLDEERGEQSVSALQKTEHQRRAVRKRLRVLKLVQRGCAIVFGAWSLYTATRYLLRYTMTLWKTKEILSIALGTSALISIAFLITHTILALPFFHNRFIHTDFPLHSLYRITLLLRLVASIFMAIPATVNFALTFVWVTDKRSRCPSTVDIDIIWGGEQRLCAVNQAAWIGMAVVRVLLTLVVVVAYNASAWSYQRMRHPSFSTFKGSISSGMLSVQAPLTISPSVSTRTGDGAPRVPKRHSPSNSSSTLRRPSSRSSEKMRTHLTTSLMSNTTPSMSGSSLPNLGAGEEEGLQNFSDRFRALVSQISREADDAVQYALQPGTYDAAQSNPSASSFSPHAQFVDLNVPTSLPSPSAPYLAYNQFDLPYPPDERVSMLGGYVRRMPTIESLGSREVTTALSRGNTSGTGSSNGVISRGNSLYLPGEMAIPYVDEDPEVVSLEEIGFRDENIPLDEGTAASYSTGTTSYHTAVDAQEIERARDEDEEESGENMYDDTMDTVVGLR